MHTGYLHRRKILKRLDGSLISMLLKSSLKSKAWMCVFFEYKWKEFQFWSLKMGIKTRAAWADQYEKASVI